VQQSKKLTLYFDQYDEMYYAYEVEADRNPFYHKYHSVEVDFSTEDDENIDLVMDDIF